MQIDPAKETLVPFAKLAKRIPSYRGDRPVAISTIHRWRLRGIKGVKLEAVKIGGRWCSTDAAYRRFVEQVTVASQCPCLDSL